MIASRTLAMRLDPVMLARACDIDPDPWQCLFLRSPSSRIICNCCRQSGKSSMAALLALHEALYHEESLILLLSPTLRQSGELFKKCMSFYRILDRPVPASSETITTITLANNSRIISLPGEESNVRGYSKPSLVILDEAARVDPDLYMAIRPMLAVGHGRLLLLSTPFGRQGVFWDAWQSEDWQKFQVEATLCPRISPEFLERERRELGAWWYEQEYMCLFKESAGALFKESDIAAAFERPIEVWTI